MHDLIHWLRCGDPSDVFAEADQVRRENVGDAVHLRGLVEVGNVCARQCGYCGIRAGNSGITRYRMTTDEILACVRRAVDLGYGTVVLQGGEDPGWSRDAIVDVIRRVRAETPLAITLSLGERDDGDLEIFREAGADRYLLRFETSDPVLYARIHPGGFRDRFAVLRRLRDLDFEVGSGIMVGIPGQTWDTLVQDLRTFQDLDLDMIGIGPYLPHPATPLGRGDLPNAGPDQVPADEDTVLRCLSLTRLLRPDANLPSTTALGMLGGREKGLRCGANVVMPNLTPARYRIHYEIYPDKAGIDVTDNEGAARLRASIAALNRTIGEGPGPRRGRA